MGLLYFPAVRPKTCCFSLLDHALLGVLIKYERKSIMQRPFGMEYLEEMATSDPQLLGTASHVCTTIDNGDGTKQDDGCSNDG